MESETKIWRPTAVRDTSLEKSYNIRVERHSPTKSYDLGSASVSQGQSRMLNRARSTTTIAPYDESDAVSGGAPCITKRD